MKINNKKLVQVESFLSRITFLIFVLVACPLLGQATKTKKNASGIRLSSVAHTAI